MNLKGTRILVTRPALQAGGLIAAINDAGGLAVPFPVLAIEPPQALAPAAALLAAVGQTRGPGLLVFISPNAVNRALPLLPSPLPPTVRIAAVGRSTAAALARADLKVDILPEGLANSESLLAHPALQQLPGQSVLIVRGEGGRELLRATLEQRGAQVDYAEVYRRGLAAHPPGRFLALSRDPGIDLAIATSNQVLENLFELAGVDGQARLLTLPLLVVSQRTVKLAASLGFLNQVSCADGADNASLLRAVQAWRNAN